MFSSNQSNAAAAAAVNYIEEVFSTFLRTSDGTTANIVNNIDLSGKGGLVWTKNRGSAQWHVLYDTVRGGAYSLTSNNTGVSRTNIAGAVTFNADGYSIVAGFAENNANANTYVDWVLRKQPKFFDIQTWSGSGANTTISHSLGSVPACIIVKRTDTAADWAVYHRSLANTQYLVLNTTAAEATGATWWNSTTPTSSVFSLGTDASVNASGGTYIAYIFAHDAGGFGLTGTDNVISCGSFTTDGSGDATVSLGYEPQFVLYKKSSTTGQWYIEDTMRGLYAPSTQGTTLIANLANAEGALNGSLQLTSTGFTVNPLGNLGTSTTSIYIAIRRGPMKVPTLGTSVHNTIGGSGANPAYVAGFPVDLGLRRYPAAAQGNKFYSRLTGSGYLDSTSTAAELADSGKFDYQNAWHPAGDGAGYYSWMFRRAPSFFDEVCYTGTGSATTFSHNLQAVPELMIFKSRSDIRNWQVYSSTLGATKNLRINAVDGEDTNTYWNNTAPTASVFSIDSSVAVNLSASTFVAYLFATCAGVSKVGSYTGTGTTKQIDCGFTAGARFVLIKRTDSTGDWYVWDTARGIVSGNDPYLLLNSVAAEVTSTDYIDTYSAGFEISSTAPAAINSSASGSTYIFLAIA